MKRKQKGYLALFVVLLMLMTTILVEGWDFSYGLIIWTIVMAAPGSFALWLLSKFKLISPKLYAWPLVVSFAAFFAFFTSQPIRNIQKNQSQKEGDRIISALEAYQKNHDKYPNEIEQLVPDYLDNIPQPKTGVFSSNHYFYFLNNAGGYFLGFRFVHVDIGGKYMYQSNGDDNYWRYDD